MTDHLKAEIVSRDGFRIHHRPGTLDLCIFDQIHDADEYRLRNARFGPGDTILDVGGHAGYFALAVLRRGAGHVHLYEIAEENIELCRLNLAPFESRVTIHRLAVAGESGRDLSFGDFPMWEDSLNTGGLTPSRGGGPHRVRTVAFDAVVGELTESFTRRIRMVKMDAEGAEWPALLTSGTLAHVDQIVGEYHEFGVGDAPEIPAELAVPGFESYTRRDLAHCLRRAGFRVRLDGDSRRWGMFYARRGPWWRPWWQLPT